MCWYVSYHYINPPPKTNANEQSASTISNLVSSVAAMKNIREQNQMMQQPIEQKTNQNPWVGIVFFTVGLMMMVGFFVYMFKTEWRINHSYIQTDCTITDKKITNSVSDKNVIYHPLFNVKYTVDGKDYTQWISSSMFHQGSSFESYEYGIYDRYEVNKQYLCWYDPDNPYYVVLERGYSPWDIFLILLIAVFSYSIYSWVKSAIKKE